MVTAWIGQNSQIEHGEWVWLDDIQHSKHFHKWIFSVIHESRGDIKDCAYLYSYTRKWHATSCWAHCYFVCEKSSFGDNQTCESNWTSHGESCYQMIDLLLTWSDAQQICHQLEADLVIVNDQEENDFIMDWARGVRYYRDVLWIGLNNRHGDHDWVWLEETQPRNYTNWVSDPPSRDNEYKCVWLYTNQQNLGKWANVNCSEKAGYICESHTIPSTETGSEYETFQGKVYVFNATMVTWHQAKVNCERLGKHSSLVTISDAVEQEFISSHISDVTTVAGFWIGVNAIEQRYNFVNVDSGENISWSNWDWDEPQYPPPP